MLPYVEPQILAVAASLGSFSWLGEEEESEEEEEGFFPCWSAGHGW